MADPTLTTISRGDLEATLSTQGGQLMSLKKEGLEYVWQGDATWWKYHAPLLFPMVGRLRGNRAQTAQGPTEMAQHGLARISVFEQVEAVEDRASYVLRANDDTRALFPFDFAFWVSYALSERGGLTVDLMVENPGTVALPFAIGGHPAFNVPVTPATGEDFSDYRIRFARPWTATSPTLDDDHLWDFGDPMTVVEESDVLPLTHRTFDVDTIMLTDVPGDMATLEGAKSHRGVTLHFPGFKYLGLWSAAGDAPFVAVEPWTGMATCADESDEFEAKRGMELLAPGGVFRRSFTIQPF